MIIRGLLTVFLFITFSTSVFGQDEVEVFVSELANHELRKNMETNATDLLNEVNSAYSENRALQLNVQELTDEARQEITELWQGSKFYVPEDRIIETVAQRTSGFYEMRNIPVYFLDPNGEELYEEGVLQFSPSGEISEFRIGLTAHRYQELLREGEDDIDRANREQILTFVEEFRTSYNRKDIDFLNTVFSDQALIIVGRVIQSTGERSAYENQVEFLQFNKEEYIERLRHLFRINEWIEVGFEEVEITRHPRFDEIYGVSLTQYYNSSIYSDVGYLFLLIDFKLPEEPMIHVRTWQPTRESPENQKFSIGDLEIL